MIAVSRAFENTAERAGLLRGTLLATSAAFTGFIGALSTNIILRYADTYTNLSNQIRVVSESSADAAARIDLIQATAARSRSALDATALLYSRIQKAAPDKSATEVLRYVETIQKALQLGGATAQESRSAAIQFSQAIASNRLSGDEIRAILETPLGLELSRGLGVTIGKMREMGQEGKLTADVVLEALDKIAGTIDSQFGRSIITVDQALIQLDNRLTAYVGSANNAYGVTRLLAQGIAGVGNNLDIILPLIGYVGAAFAAAFIGKKISNVGGGVLEYIKNDATQAKERVIDLQDRISGLRKQIIDADVKLADTQKAAAAGTAAFADPAAVKSALRAEEDLKRARADTAASFEKIQQAQRDLAATSTQLSPKIIKLSDDRAAAEARINQNLQKQASIQKYLATLRTTELGVPSSKGTYTGKADEVAQSTKMRLSLEKEAVSVEKAIANDRAAIAKQTAQIDVLRADSDQKAVDKRIEGARKLATLQQAYTASYSKMGAALVESQAAQRSVSISGERNAQQAITEQTKSVHGLSTALGGLRQSSAAAVAATGTLASGLALGRAAAGGLIAALGGPWGIAITGAILFLGMLAAKAAKTAQDVNRATRIIEDRLRKMADKADAEGERARESLIDLQTEKTKADLKDVEAQYNRALESITSQKAIATPGTKAANKTIIELQNQIISLVKLYAEGDIGADQFRQSLDAIEASAPGLGGITKAAKDNADALQQAVRAAKDLKGSLGLLAGGATLGSSKESMRDRARTEARTELDQQRALIGLQGISLAIQEKYLEYKKKFPLLTEAELKAEAEKTAILEGAARDSDLLAQYQRQAQEIKTAGTAQEVYTTALHKWLAALKNGTNLSYEDILAQEKKIATSKQVAAAFKEIEQAAAAAAEEEEREAGIRAKSFGDFFSNIANKLNTTRLEAQGRKEEVRALELMADARRDNVSLSYEEAVGYARRQIAMENYKDSMEKARREQDSFNEKLKRLKEEAQGAFLGDIDRAVLEHGRAMKASAADLAAYVKAAESGDFSGVPKKLLELRDIELLKAAGAEYRNIIQLYGSISQIAPMAANELSRLNAGIAKNKITTEQAKLAYIDFMATFQQYKWITGVTDAFGNFADAIIDDFNNMGEAADNFKKALIKVAAQMLIIEPMKNSLKILFADFGLVPTPGLTGTAGVKHAGGVVGEAGPSRRVSVASFAGSPRLHAGLTSREFRTILERGEHVLTAKMASRTAGVMSGLAASVGPGGGYVDNRVYNFQGTGAELAEMRKLVNDNHSKVPGIAAKTIVQAKSRRINLAPR